MIVTTLLCAIGIAAAQPQAIRFEELQGRSGHWLDPGDFPRQGPRWSEMFVSRPARWQMVGVSRTHDGFDRRSFEHLWLEQEEDGIVLHLASDGRPAIGYRLVQAGSEEAVFESLEANYPQRLVYRRDGDRLLVTRSKLDGSYELVRTFLPYEQAIEARTGPGSFDRSAED